MARAFNDRHSRRFYCGVLWKAVRSGSYGIGQLQAILSRLGVDRQEWPGLRRLAALFNSRLPAFLRPFEARPHGS